MRPDLDQAPAILRQYVGSTRQSPELAIQCSDKCMGAYRVHHQSFTKLHQEYRDVNRTYSDAAQTLSTYASLTPRTEVYSMAPDDPTSEGDG